MKRGFKMNLRGESLLLKIILSASNDIRYLSRNFSFSVQKLWKKYFQMILTVLFIEFMRKFSVFIERFSISF